ncbi:hypothetical protein [Stenomitos frigidus]|nr:hypothetical protein [Stenomitos frigidus]
MSEPPSFPVMQLTLLMLPLSWLSQRSAVSGQRSAISGQRSVISGER